MKITVWQTFSQQAIVNDFKYQVYYETSPKYSGQDDILLNNIIKALGWADIDVNLQVIDNDSKLLEGHTGRVFWFGFDSAMKLGLIQNPSIQKLNNITFFPSPQEISKNTAFKRQVWQILKPLKI